jgi:mannose-6-phosphate isomerase-like protein (cupin superfamily)
MAPMIHTELTAKRFDSPDAVREFEGGMGRAEIVHLGDRTASRSTFKPGFRWSEHIKPLAETERCEVFHLGYIISGNMRVTMHDGHIVELGPGDAFEIPPDHDSEVIGDAECVLVDFGDMADYAVAHH